MKQSNEGVEERKRIKSRVNRQEIINLVAVIGLAALPGVLMTTGSTPKETLQKISNQRLTFLDKDER